MTKRKRKKYLSLAGGLIVLAFLLAGAWNLWFGTTKIGFLNYQVINLGEIAKANHNPFIRIAEITTDQLDNLEKYDMIFINGMGLRITEEQRERIEQAATRNLPVLTTAATNPANNI